MSQFYLKFVLQCLNDEENLAQNLPSVVHTLLHTSNTGNDEASLAKLHARISVLLQSKSTSVLWSAVCLAKAVLERPEGRWPSLISHGSTWLRLLLKVLEKEAHETVIERTISTITSIFQMTDGKPSLTRDLTTPSLPTFFTHVFSILGKAHVTDNLAKNILYHMQSLLVKYPTTFRPFAGKLQSYSTRLINGSCTDEQLVELAARCYASLHLCAPKSASSEQWTTGFLAVVGECHATLTYILQIVTENKPHLPVPAGMDMLLFSSDYSSQLPLAVRRLRSLIETVSAFLALPTKDIVKVPIGQLIMLLHRMLETTARSGTKASTPQASQVALISVLPQLHELAFDLASTSIETLRNHMMPHLHALQEFALIDSKGNHLHCQIAAMRALQQTVEYIAVQDKDKVQFLKIVNDCTTKLANIVPPSSSSIATESRQNGQAQGLKKRKHGGANEGSDQISHDLAFHQAPTPALEAIFNLLSTTLQRTFGVLTKGTRQNVEVTVLRLLASHGSQMDAPTTIALLRLLRTAIMAPEPSVSAAAVLSAGVHIFDTYANHHDHRIRQEAAIIRDVIEVMIHPRFPSVRRRLPDFSVDLAETDTQDEDEEVDDVVEQETEGEMFSETTHEIPEAQSEPRESAFKVPDHLPALQIRQPEAASIVDTTERETETPAMQIAQERTMPVVLDDADGDDASDEEMPQICTDSDTDEEEE